MNFVFENQSIFSSGTRRSTLKSSSSLVPSLQADPSFDVMERGTIKVKVLSTNSLFLTGLTNEYV